MGSLLNDLGGEGISIVGNDAKNVLIHNNIVNDTGKVYLGQPAGIRLRGALNITVTNNQVSFSPYGGILIGWGTPTQKPPTGTPPVFTVSFNLVENFG